MVRTAILGWGSLIWNAGPLNIHPEWHRDGPVLPIEFSRISGAGKDVPTRYLSLVIDRVHGVDVQCLYAVSKEPTVDTAVRNLAVRETGSPSKTKSIASLTLLDVSQGDYTSSEEQRISEWARAKQLDAVVWTALKPNFAELVGKEFSLHHALDYLLALPAPEAARAWEYIARAPASTETPFRAYLRASQRDQNIAVYRG